MSKNHGYLQPVQPEKPKAAAIPRFLRNQQITFRSDREWMEKTFGIWEMRALKDVPICGTVVKKDETFKCVGPEAVMLARHGDAIFCDERALKEAEILQKAKDIGLDKIDDPRQMDQFIKQQPLDVPQSERRAKWDPMPAAK